MSDAPGFSSTRPYLIRAIHEWCTENGLTPYLAVQVDDTVQVPREYVKNGEIVLNVSFDATSGLKIGNDIVVFSARFSGKAREIMIPVERVIAIYARENGQGMAFPRPEGDAGGASTPGTTEARSEAPAVSREHGVHGEAEVRLVESVPAKGGSTDLEPPPDPGAPTKRPRLTRIK